MSPQEESEGAAEGGGASSVDDGRKYADYTYEQLLQRVADIITAKVCDIREVGRRSCKTGGFKNTTETRTMKGPDE